MASLLPTLPLYIEHIGASKQEIGIVMGAFAIGLLPSRAWLGPMADRRGRKIVLIIGPIVGTIAALGYLLLKTVPALFFLRAFHGISIAAFTTAYSALVTDISPPEKRGELLGYMSLVQPIGVALGPALGGLFLQPTENYFALFLMAAGVGFLAFLACIPIQEPPKETENLTPPKTAQTKQFWQILWSPAVRIPAFVMLMTGFVFGVLHTFIPLYLKESGANLNAGLFYTAAAIASFSIRLLIGRASDRYGRGIFITASLICYIIAMLTLWRATTGPEFLIAAVLEGSASGTIFPMVIALMSDRCLPHQRGQFFSLSVGGLDFGMVMAGPIMGFIAEYTGYRHLFGIAAGLSLVGLVAFATLSSKNIPSSLRFAMGRTKDIYALGKE
ncbi:MFS transporter [Ancylothrix sp. C2]|nr:MFS transporter [Ancylothrix sp. D3o]